MSIQLTADTFTRRLAPKSRKTMVLLGGILITGVANQSNALIIQPIYDSSVTSLANASTVEGSFQAAANVFSSEFSTPITVKIGVSFGKVAGHAIPSGDIGTSYLPLSGAYAYADVKSALQSTSGASPADAVLASIVAHLPSTDPAKLNNYEIPYAEAQALGLLPSSLPLNSGYIGFKTGVAFDYNEADGTAAGAYDFQGLAQHEIAEVLGRLSGIPSSGTPQYSTPFDILRYTAAGTSSFSSSAHAYFSADGGVSDLGNFNYSGGGDRGDWLGSTNDSFNAYLRTGTSEPVSGNDLTVLDALGYGAWSATGTQGANFKTTTFAIGSGSAVPEPNTWAMLFVGMFGVGALLRKRSEVTLPAARSGAGLRR